jgi:hypothetical protein
MADRIEAGADTKRAAMAAAEAHLAVLGYRVKKEVTAC